MSSPSCGHAPPGRWSVPKRQLRRSRVFQDHPEEAVQAAAMCATGTKGGEECVNAQAGIVAIEREARDERYRATLRLLHRCRLASTNRMSAS